jgi:uncharacterized membrane protein
MITIRRSVLIERDLADVFRLISDPDRYREFLTGITRWEPRSRKLRGEGAKFKVLMKVGAAEAGGLVRVTEWKESETIAWEAEQGIDHRGRWLVKPAKGGTSLELEIAYQLPGPFGRLVERLAGRTVGRNMAATLLAARRVLEYEDRVRLSEGVPPTGT